MSKLLKLGTTSGGDLSSKKEFISVRVIDIILNTDHPRATSLGGVDAIGTIFYGDISSNKGVSNSETLPTAKPLFSYQKYLPLINEIVLLTEIIINKQEKSIQTLNSDEHKLGRFLALLLNSGTFFSFATIFSKHLFKIFVFVSFKRVRQQIVIFLLLWLRAGLFGSLSEGRLLLALLWALGASLFPLRFSGSEVHKISKFVFEKFFILPLRIGVEIKVRVPEEELQVI